MRRRHLLAAAGAALAGCTSITGGEETPASTPSPTPTPPESDLSLTSSAFDDGGSIPEQYTCDGDDVSPPLSIDDVPNEVATFALVMDDPDAPQAEPFVHWLLWNLPSDTTQLPEDVPKEGEPEGLDGRQGTNSFDEVGYGGPCPPEEDDAHTYRFQLFALSTPLELEAGAERGELESAMVENIVAEALLRGEYERG
jgi:Raf kinase inhibitor-like YbhB/YbcL family protein